MSDDNPDQHLSAPLAASTTPATPPTGTDAARPTTHSQDKSKVKADLSASAGAQSGLDEVTTRNKTTSESGTATHRTGSRAGWILKPFFDWWDERETSGTFRTKDEIQQSKQKRRKIVFAISITIALCAPLLLLLTSVTQRDSGNAPPSMPVPNAPSPPATNAPSASTTNALLK